jgi:hypothetical protein
MKRTTRDLGRIALMSGWRQARPTISRARKRAIHFTD